MDKNKIDLPLNHTLRYLYSNNIEPTVAEAAPGTSGISFRVKRNGVSESLFVALIPNIFAFHRGTLKRRGIPDEVIAEFLRAVGALPCADPKKFETQSEPRLLVDKMSDADARHLLESAIRLVRNWQASSG